MRLTSGSFLCMAVVVTTSAFGVAWYNRHATTRAEVTLARLARERADLIAHLAKPERPRPTVVEPVAPARPNSPAPPPPAAAKNAAAAAPAPNYHQRYRQDPELQALRLEVDRARAAAHYGPLFRMLGLSPEQRARFQENWIRHNAEMSDLAAAVGPGGPSDNDEAVLKLRAQIEQRYAESQRTLLGDTAARTALDYEQNIWIREMVGSVAGSAVLAGMPLSPEQAEQLTQVMIADSNDTRNEKRDFQALLDWSRIDVRAQGILTSAQANLLKRIEPGGNGRFQMLLDQAVDAAHKADREQAARIAAANVDPQQSR